MGLRSRLSTWRSRNPRAEAAVRIVAPWQTYQSSAVGSTPDAYLDAYGKNGVVFQIVSHTAESVAAPEWCLKRIQPDGEEIDVPKHPVLTLLNRPNPLMSRTELFEQLQQYIELLGEGALQVTMVGKVPIELWPLMPHRMIPITHPTRMITGWQYITPGGETVEIPGGLTQVIRIRRPHPTDLLRGMGPVQPAMSDIDTSWTTGHSPRCCTGPHPRNPTRTTSARS
jgi:phage portal protein BeeE